MKILTYKSQPTYKHVARIEEISNADGCATLSYEVLGVPNNYQIDVYLNSRDAIIRRAAFICNRHTCEVTRSAASPLAQMCQQGFGHPSHLFQKRHALILSVAPQGGGPL